MTAPTLHLLCGLPGSGKTTLAKWLEAELPALRLTEDEWVARFFPPEAAHDDAIRVPVKDVQWDLAVRAIRLGITVVLDWGVWAREERDDFRSRAVALKIPLTLHFLDVPFAELVRRLDQIFSKLLPETVADFARAAAEVEAELAAAEVLRNQPTGSHPADC